MANLKQLKCPSCGAVLNQEFPNQLIVECPYCHQQVVNSQDYISNKSDEPRVLEFSMNESDVVKTMTDMLIKDPCVPTDIFDLMNIISINKYYVPMYIFEGTYRAPWTAQISRLEERQRIGRDGKVENYYETLYDYPTGEAVGNFSINAVPSKELNTLGLDSSELQCFSVNPTSLPFFSSIMQNKDEGIVCLSPSEDSNSVWFEFGEQSAKHVGIEAASIQSPGPTRCSASCELKKTSFVYIPIWVIDYSYNSNKYYYILYAERYGSITNPNCDMPMAQPTEEQQEILNKNKEKRNGFEGWKAIIFLSVIVGELSLFIGGGLFEIHFLKVMANDGWVFWLVLLGGIFYVATCFFHNEEKLIEIEESISEDIDKRTKMLLTEVENYKRRKRDVIYVFKDVVNKNSNNQMVADIMVNDKTDASLNSRCVHPTKYCVKCGEEINYSHTFCRYCGAKQG